MIIPMIIQIIGLGPSGSVWTDKPSNVSRPDRSGAVQVDAEHPSCNRKVVGSNPTSGSKTAAQRVYMNLLPMTLLAPLIILMREPGLKSPVRYVGRRPWQAAPTLRLFHCRVRLGSSLCPRRRRHHNSPFAR